VQGAADDQPGTAGGGGQGSPASQTLDRGLRVLETLAGRTEPMSVTGLAAALGLHRSIIHRVLSTLADHRLVRRLPSGQYVTGAGLVTLARHTYAELQAAVLPELAALADDVGMLAFLTVRDGDDAVTVATVAPRHNLTGTTHREGLRHSLDRGAPALALLAGGAPHEGERPEVTRARERGWVRTTGEVAPGTSAVAAPVAVSGEVLAAVSVLVLPEAVDERVVAARVCEAAAAATAVLT